MFKLFLRDIQNLSPVLMRDPVLKQLSPIERVILACDATLTEILEAYFGEKIIVNKLNEQLLQPNQDIPLLNSSDPVIFRESLLLGANSKQVMMYARSLIDFGALLSKDFKADLLSTTIPLGYLFKSHQMEIFRKLLGYKIEEDSLLLKHFGVVAGELVSRTNLLYINAKPIMLITEKFLRAALL